MITLAIPTLRRFDLLTTCVWSALAGTVRPDRVIVIDNSGGRCPAIPGAEIVLGRQPQSVAKAWNDAARLAAGDWLILSNDDVQFAPDTIERMLDVAQANPRAGIVSVLEGLRFCLFLLRWEAYQAVGPFDERFAPAYFEDNDYHRRLTLARWESPVAPSAIQHEHSGTMKALSIKEREQQHHVAFRLCARLYQQKWGGLPGQEQYLEPRT
jgi:GT2 family glycosyltransferase